MREPPPPGGGGRGLADSPESRDDSQPVCGDKVEERGAAHAGVSLWALCAREGTDPPGAVPVAGTPGATEVVARPNPRLISELALSASRLTPRSLHAVLRPTLWRLGPRQVAAQAPCAHTGPPRQGRSCPGAEGRSRGRQVDGTERAASQAWSLARAVGWEGPRPGHWGRCVGARGRAGVGCPFWWLACQAA